MTRCEYLGEVDTVQDAISASHDAMDTVQGVLNGEPLLKRVQMLVDEVKKLRKKTVPKSTKAPTEPGLYWVQISLLRDVKEWHLVRVIRQIKTLDGEVYSPGTIEAHGENWVQVLPPAEAT